MQPVMSNELTRLLHQSCLRNQIKKNIDVGHFSNIILKRAKILKKIVTAPTRLGISSRAQRGV
jgi:hypothetical protein